jgi:hypothetical protein
MADPIAQWGEIASQDHANASHAQGAPTCSIEWAGGKLAFGGAAASLISDLNQQPMDVAPLHVRASELDTAAKHAIYALVSLIAALREVIDSLCGSCLGGQSSRHSGVATVPDMKEFFQFAWADRQYVMRKRQWP